MDVSEKLHRKMSGPLFCSFNVGIKGLMTHSTHYTSLRIYFYSTTKSLTSDQKI